MDKVKKDKDKVNKKKNKAVALEYKSKVDKAKSNEHDKCLI